jgi:dihydrofolate synthase/folylpolyglutamate synthase
VQPGATLVLGSSLHPDAVAVAERVAAARGARIVQAPADPGVEVGAPGANPDGIRAVAESLPELVGEQGRVVAVVSILDDKDAAGMLAALGESVDELVLTHADNPRALSPGTLLSLARQVHGPHGEIVSDPRGAVRRARELAGPDGVVIATGALKLVGDLLAGDSPRRISVL